MIAATRTASFVAVNPTHLATAVRYVEGSNEAPRVIAKGVGDVARRIRREAEAAGVEVLRDVPLARSLFRVPLDGEIPEALYAAVAEVLVSLAELERTRARDATPSGDG
jgi:flagellar biosynthetic protein FlhB